MEDSKGTRTGSVTPSSRVHGKDCLSGYSCLFFFFFQFWGQDIYAAMTPMMEAIIDNLSRDDAGSRMKRERKRLNAVMSPNK